MADIIPLKFIKTVGGAVVAPSELNPGDTIPSIYVGGLVGSNMLINCGAPVVNQRGFAGGALAANVYGYDRWKAGTGGCNITINATTGVFTHTSGPLVQVVEAPEAAWGVPVTLSVESPSGTISVNIGGATGSISAGVGRRSITLTPTGSGNMAVQLTATGVTYSQPRLERGAVMTVPEYRSAAIEVALCQRYYEKSYTPTDPPATVTRAGAFISSVLSPFFLTYSTPKFVAPKRAVPAVSVYSTRTGAANMFAEVNTSGVFVADRVASVTNVGVTGFEVRGTNTATAGALAELQWTADAEL